MENDFITLHSLQDGTDTHVRFARIVGVETVERMGEPVGSILRLCQDSNGPIYVAETFEQITAAIDRHIRRLATGELGAQSAFGEVLA